MTDKLKITKEQEKALGHIKGATETENNFKWFLDRRFSTKSSCYEFKDFTPEQFALLLCGWYEVEEQFKVDDWVFHKTADAPEKVIFIKNNSKEVETEHFFDRFKRFRHATDEEVAQEKERRKWATIDREVNEYKLGDIIKDDQGTYAEVEKLLESYVETNVDPNGITHSLITLVVPVEQRFDKECIV